MTGEGFEANVSEDGKTLIIEVDLTTKGTPSASGKSMVIATTRGNVNINGVTLGLNVYRKKAR